MVSWRLRKNKPFRTCHPLVLSWRRTIRARAGTRQNGPGIDAVNTIIKVRYLRTNSHSTEASMASWLPLQETLGDLPLKVDPNAVQYPITLSVAPSELLVYAFITLEDVLPTGFQRGYYEIFTRRNDGTEFKFYMNVALTNNTVINSENVWLPYGAGFERAVYVRLVGTPGTSLEPKKKVKSCKGKDCATVLKEHAGHNHDNEEDVQVGVIFLTGYRS